MKTLYLMRHAKSSWKHPELEDIDRPLNPRGRRDAPEMGRRLAARGPLPQRILCSPARRTRETAEAVLVGAGEVDVPCKVDDRLYFRGASGWLEAIRETDDRVETLLVVGHNPDFSRLLARLAGWSESDLPTASLATLAVNADWKNIALQPLRMLDLDWPKRKPGAFSPD